MTPAGTQTARHGAADRDRMRELSWQDIPRLVELEKVVFDRDAWSAETWWAELAGRPRRAYVVLTEPDEPVPEADGRIVGYAGIDLGADVADVMTIAVDPSRRGRGLGPRLLDWLVQTAVAGGVSRLTLEVRGDNDAARRLYARSGFEVATVRRRYYQPGDVDAVVMWRDVGAPATAARRPGVRR